MLERTQKLDSVSKLLKTHKSVFCQTLSEADAVCCGFILIDGQQELKLSRFSKEFCEH